MFIAAFIFVKLIQTKNTNEEKTSGKIDSCCGLYLRFGEELT